MKTKLKIWLQRTSAGLLLGSGVLLSAGCVVRGTAYSTGPSGVYYDYDYYPDVDVYFYPQSRIYYWNDRGHWRSSRRLPPHYVIREEHREHLRLHSRQPWTERGRGRDTDRLSR